MTKLCTSRVHGVLELYRFLYFQEVTYVVYHTYCIFNKITQLYYVFIQRLLCVSNIRHRWVCCAEKRGFPCFLTVTDSLLKLLGYPEHYVYSERVCYCPNLYRHIKWYVYARKCMGTSYFRQNVYIQRYIFGHKCIRTKTKGLTILYEHQTKIFTECPTPYRGITSWAWWGASELALPSPKYPKFRSRPSTQPLGHGADNLCYIFIFSWLKSTKTSLNCLFLKYNGIISFLVLKTIQIDILYMFVCSLF